ncbi:MAG TPA: hypothetical protein VJO52_05800 [Gemmatimonadaceae bacterium]|nr:hypothetical protein [Gemmatimonadaceae bacterium]
MRGIRAVAFVALFAALAAGRLTAQAGAPPTTKAVPALDPCSLLTAAEVSSVLGIQSLPGRPFLGSKKVCMWAPDTNNTIGNASVTVMVVTRAAFDNGKVLDASMMHSVSGVGDDAYAVGSGSYLKLGVRKGDRAFSVTVVGGTQIKATAAQLQQMEVQLATKALARL